VKKGPIISERIGTEPQMGRREIQKPFSDKVKDLVQMYFPNQMSTEPNNNYEIFLRLGKSGPSYVIRTWPDQEKVKVTQKGLMRNLLGLSKGRWQSIDSFEAWLQDQTHNMRESKFPKFKQFCLSEDADIMPRATVDLNTPDPIAKLLHLIINQPGPITVINVPNDIINSLNLQESNIAENNAIKYAIAGSIAAISGAIAYAIAKAAQAGRKIEAELGIPGKGNGSINIGGTGGEEPIEQVPQVEEEPVVTSR